MKKMIYCDSAASTPIYKQVAEEMTSLSLVTFGNRKLPVLNSVSELNIHPNEKSG